MWLDKVGPWWVLVLAGLVRAVLICWAEFQDRHLPVKYTDIDYVVFTDAARFVAAGGSPYQRATYRYSPLLAYLLLPNIWLHPAWGKVLFSVSDIAVAGLLHYLLARTGAPRPLRVAALLLWLFNPYTATISTRGSCDVLSVLLLLCLLACLLYGKPLASGALYGLAVHFRIYPVIYGPAIALYLMRRATALDAQRRGSPRPRGTGVGTDGSAALAAGQGADETAKPEEVKAKRPGARTDPEGESTAEAAAEEAGEQAVTDRIARLRQRSDHRSAAVQATAPEQSGADAGAGELQNHRRQSGGGKRRGGLMSACLLPPNGPMTAAMAVAALREAVRFGAAAAISFVLLGALFYHLYGNEFLREAFLHHLTRKDPRHNFSPYYYPVYLSYGSSTAGPMDGDTNGAANGGGGRAGGGSTAAGLLLSRWRAVWRVMRLDEPWKLAMLPQAAALLALAMRFHTDLPAAWLLQTWCFVTLNKVVTAQYFVWYLSLLPLALPALAAQRTVSWRALAAAGAAWVAAQLHWLAWAYQLEMRGRSVHVPLWAAGLVFQLANTALVVLLARALLPGSRRDCNDVSGGCGGGGSNSRGPAGETPANDGTVSEAGAGGYGNFGMTFLDASLVLARPPPRSAITPASQNRKQR